MLALSNNNRTVTSSSPGQYGSVAGTGAHTTGDGNKYYFEGRMDNYQGQVGSWIDGVGVCTSTDTGVGTAINTCGNTATEWGMTASNGGSAYGARNNANTGNFIGNTGVSSGDILQVAVDCSANRIYFGVNNIWNSGAFNSGSPDFTLPGSTVLLPMASILFVGSTSDQITVNFGNAVFIYTPPTGYIAWG